MRTVLATIVSPQRTLSATIGTAKDGHLAYVVTRPNGPGGNVCEGSLGITVDAVTLGSGDSLVESESAERNDTYPTRGWHSVAIDSCKTMHLSMVHVASKVRWVIEVRLFDDAFAFRYRVPGHGERRISGEASSWRLPRAERIWFAERPNNWKLKSYAGYWMSSTPPELSTASPQGPIQPPPVVAELSDGGYAAISEAALYEYSGMRLEALADGALRANFSEGEAGFELSGDILTPWRVALITDDLNGLVNSDIWTNLNLPPDPVLFADTTWIKLGRVAWRWWSLGTGTPSAEGEMVELASQLGWEYSLIDDGWEAWSEPWDEVARICQRAKGLAVRVLLWKDYNNVIHNPANHYQALTQFLDACVRAGVAGVKIDFMNSEALDKIHFQQAALIETAKRHLVLLFHGCQKPTGESRTYPHEVTREGIRGLELNKMDEGPITSAHNAALPFTRFLVGHGDYTPVGFTNPGATTWGHQLATSVLFTSPVNVLAENPRELLTNPALAPALDFMRSLPTVWAETIVLPSSSIGKRAFMARRSGNT
ncbi:MAG TPA: glycoside hydrolase family 97 catalytic domain-containing protein [Capsulimonadaceae bacterium]